MAPATPLNESDLPDLDVLIESLDERLSNHLSAKGIDNPLLVGIHSGGVWIAERLHARLTEGGLTQLPLGSLDISFYRDDFTRIGLNPKIKPSELPLATEDQHIVLIDDVVMSGRTVRAALNHLFEYGRPASVTLIALFDLNARELPIQADIVGQQLDLPTNQRIKLNGPDPLSLSLQTLS